MIVAFFDVDNTLIPDPSMEIRFIGYLIRKGVLDIKDGLRVLFRFIIYLLILSPGLIRYNKIYLKGKEASEIKALAKDFFYSEIVPKISQKALAAIEGHRSEGHKILFITGTLDFLAELIRDYLRADGLIVSQLEQVGGRYTGRTSSPFPYKKGKRELIGEYAEEEGIELDLSYAYGDRYSDRFLMGIVGHPVAVNPDRRLLRVARLKGWDVKWWD